MKTFKKVVIISLIAALVAAVAVFAVGCAEEPVTITFETNGGVAIAPLTVEISKEFDLPTPTKDGSVFEGWYKSASLEGESVTGKVTATENTTYYAKWTQLYTLTLDAAGGTVAQTTFSMKAGDNVYEKVSGLTPTYAHHEFAGWYDGTKAVTASSVMPASPLTLTASYKTEYSIEIWTQKEEGGTEYVKAETVTGYEKVGKNFTADHVKNGYTEVDNANARTEGRIDEDYTKNVFRLYFNVQTFKVTFYSNYPNDSGLAAENKMETHLYGDKIAAPYDLFEVDGYVLLGWADSLTGSVKYRVDYLATKSINVDGTAADTAEITVEKNISLFAVWKKGFYNLFGGSDLIYYPDESSSDIYLERGGLYFKGTYLARSNYFDFSDKNGNVMLEGKLMDAEGNDVTAQTLNDTAAFAVRNEERDTSSYNLYKVGTGMNKFTHIIFDEYNGVTYGGQNQIPSEGIYYIDADGYYVINYHSGPLADTRMIVTINDSGDVKTFRVRNEEEYAYGTLLRGVVVGSELRYYNKDVAYGLTMDGFGNATYDNGSTTVKFSYSATENEKEYTLLYEDSEVGTIKVFEAEGFYYYMFCSSEYAHEYKISDTASLTLDGVNSLVYTDGDKTIEAYYTLASSVMGGNIAVFYDATGKQYLFLIRSVTVNDELGDTTSQGQTEYIAYEKAANYAEYYFKDGANIYYGPMVVFNGEEDGTILAEVWMRTAAGKMEKVSDGTVTTNQAGHYVYTETTKTTVEDAAVKPIDFATVKSFEFEVGALSRNGSVYNVNYWYSYTDNENNVYTSTVTYGTGEKTFTVIMPLGTEEANLLMSDTGIYYDGKDAYKGVYAVNDDGSIALRCNISVQTAYGQSTYEQAFYFRIKGNDLTVLESAPHRIALRKTDGNFDNKYLYFDGESGKATLVEIDLTNGEVVRSLDGTFAENGTTSDLTHVGYLIYTFTAQGMAPVDYIIYTQTKEAFFVRYPSGLEMRYPAGSGVAYLYSADYSGQFTSDDGYLQLDGFGARAIYVSEGGETVAGYTVNENGELCMYADGKYLYFDLKVSDKTFTARGSEYGVYALYDNNYNKNVYFDLDGYGKLTVYKTVGGSKQYIDQNGTYAYNDADKSVTFAYNGGSETYAKGFLLTVNTANGALKAFVPYSDEVVGTYINNKNWAVLVLDSAGRAYSYDKNGFMSTGRVTLVTESLLYFADDNGEDGSVFNYDKTTRVISVFSATQRAYYTADFKSLIFLKNGFVVISGETVGYYTVTSGNVAIYRQTGDGKYGFSADTSFGSFTDESDYMGNHYYRSSGNSITFDRDATATENYKLSLNDKLSEIGGIYFTPPGTDVFKNVLGNLEIDHKFYDCKITRTEDAMFITIGLSDGSSYRIYITADYRGAEGSTYSVTGIERVNYIYSSKYLSNYFMYYYYYGSAAAQSYVNNYGTLEIVDSYNENGEVVSSYAEGKFGSASEFYDYNGDELTFKASYELKKEVSAGTDLYVVSFTAADGFKYNAYFIVGMHPYMNRPAYLCYFGREEVVESGDGVYEVVIERIAASDMGIEVGSLSDVNVKKNGEKLNRYAAALIDGVIYFIVKADSGTTYYFIDVRYENTGEIGNSDSILKIAGVEVTEKPATTYKTEDGEDYVDFVDGKLIVMSVTTSSGKKTFIITGYEYDEQTGVYTVTTSDNVYTLTIVDGKAVITFTDKEKEEGEKPQN